MLIYLALWYNSADWSGFSIWNILLGNSRRENEAHEEREKLHTFRPAGFENRRRFSYAIDVKIFLYFHFTVALCSMQRTLDDYWLDLTWLDLAVAGFIPLLLCHWLFIWIFRISLKHRAHFHRSARVTLNLEWLNIILAGLPLSTALDRMEQPFRHGGAPWTITFDLRLFFININHFRRSNPGTSVSIWC